MSRDKTQPGLGRLGTWLAGGKKPPFSEADSKCRAVRHKESQVNIQTVSPVIAAAARRAAGQGEATEGTPKLAPAVLWGLAMVTE